MTIKDPSEQCLSRQIKTMNGFEGRTIREVSRHWVGPWDKEVFVLLFTDKTFAVLEPDYSYSDVSINIRTDAILADFLLKFGVITQGKWDQWQGELARQKKIAEQKTAKEKAHKKDKRDRSEYRRLKKKFEGVDVE